MSWCRASLVLPCAAVISLCCSFVVVDASPCLSSASAVRQEYPGAWPSWTLRLRGHDGAKCWYPATRATAHHHDYVRISNKDPIGRGEIRATKERPMQNGSLSTLMTKQLGWSPRSTVTEVSAAPAPEKASFAERFAAVFDKNPDNRTSIMELIIGSNQGGPALPAHIERRDGDSPRLQDHNRSLVPPAESLSLASTGFHQNQSPFR
jgi:hypothetical protein